MPRASAAKVGVNAEVVHFDEASGVMLCRFIDGGITLNAERFKDLGSVRRSAVALRRVHDSAAPFLNRFELFQMIDEYLDILAQEERAAARRLSRREARGGSGARGA